MENVNEEGIRNGSEKINRAVNQAKNAGNDLKERATDLKDRATEEGSRVYSEVRDGIRDIGSSFKKTGSAAYSQAKDIAGDTYDQVASRTKDGAEKIEGQIKDYPLYAVGAAFGAGLLFGAYLFNKSTR